MQNSKVLKVILFVLGLMLIVFGTWRMTSPVEFFTFSGIELGNDVSMLSEVRGAGGMVLGSGIIILLGAFFPTLTYTSSIISVLVFLSFGFARLLGIAFDGLPGEMIIQGIISEFVAGSVALFALFKYRKKPDGSTISTN